MSRTPFSNVNNIHVHSIIPEYQKNKNNKADAGIKIRSAWHTYYSHNDI